MKTIYDSSATVGELVVTNTGIVLSTNLAKDECSDEYGQPCIFGNDMSECQCVRAKCLALHRLDYKRVIFVQPFAELIDITEYNNNKHDYDELHNKK